MDIVLLDGVHNDSAATDDGYAFHVAIPFVRIVVDSAADFQFGGRGGVQIADEHLGGRSRANEHDAVFWRRFGHDFAEFRQFR